MKDKELKDFLPDKNSSYLKIFENTNILAKIKKEQIIECIRTVMDPEIPVNLYNCRLIVSGSIFFLSSITTLIPSLFDSSLKSLIPSIFLSLTN